MSVDTCLRSARPTVLWLKVHELFGFTGIAGGSTPADLDSDIAPRQVDNLLGAGIYAQLAVACENKTADLEDSFAKVLTPLGWLEDESLYACNGDVAAFAFCKSTEASDEA